MKSFFDLKKAVLIVLAFILGAAMLLTAGCGGDKPAETPASTTPEPSTPTPTPEETPEETPDRGEVYNITYDLDGGIDGGNPTEYNNLTDLPILVPIKVGYDFIGWTGTGITEPTVSLTVKAGTEGDIALKANWRENGEFSIRTDKTPDDVLGKVLKGNGTVAFVVDSVTPAPYMLEVWEYQDLFLKNDIMLKLIQLDDLVFASKHDFRFYAGITGHEPIGAIYSTLNYTEYAVEVGEDYINVIGWTEAANAVAFDIFNEILEHVALGGSYSHLVGATFRGSIEGQIGADVPVMPGFDAVTDVGDGAFNVYKLDSTMEEYTAYLAKLEAAGYTKYTENKMGEIAYASTYVSEDTVVTVNFTAGSVDGQLGKDADRSLRAVVEPLANTALPPLELLDTPAEVVTDCSVGMLDHSTIDDGNLCLVFQLPNGHFIIVDSNRNGSQNGLFEYLRAKAPDKDNIVIEAWFLTHFHQDHIGGFIDYTGISKNMRYTTVKNVIYNFPSEQVLSTASHSAVDMNNVLFFNSKRKPDMQKKGTTFYRARTGQKYYFDGAEVELLWTFEDIAPHNIVKDRSNPTCIGFSLTIAGQKFMITGDSSVEEFTAAYLRYGSYLKSDFVQLSHHGYGDMPSTGVFMQAENFYRQVNAPYVLNSGMGKSYGAPEKWAMENATVYFLRDELGTCVIPLPYDGGDYEAELK